ncbi:XRE family transcriptional regulator [Brevibacillus sp. MER 51]|uniref:XRE family transcriptional regulator n=1 Tax=Brevibacillus sp. MER 51 TaxID=2939560 RepID=UPI00203EE154|nr:XRE family transcriptional regulator [Brevibacillus sp. MER 51]MCM3143086.1 XRE family transcriptional regulator [Brevibacillus sp. MER 51]
MEFDKAEFARLLNLAKGTRSINKFGMDSGVDPGYISRLLRCLIENPPSALIIKKLAEKAHNDIAPETLMIAAGYIEDGASSLTDKKDKPLSEYESLFFYELDKLSEEDKKKALEHVRYLRYLAEQQK